MDATLRSKLRKEIGPAVATETAWTPGSVDELAAVLRALDAAALGWQVSSGAPGKDAGGEQLSLQRLDSVEVRAGAGVVVAGAGATLDAIRSAVQKPKLAVVGLSASGTPAHAGSTVAAGAVPRRALCGIVAVLADGSVVRAGGTLKDVAGYDLCGVLLGSAGRLGVIAEVTLRLAPAGAQLPTASAPGVRKPAPSLPDLAQAFDPGSRLRG